MKIIVTHASPDWDAITSVWILKRFLPGWENAEVKFVMAGERLAGSKQPASTQRGEQSETVEDINGNEVIHVDTGMGPLDHHQVFDMSMCAASRCWDYARVENSDFTVQNDKTTKRIESIDRIVKYVIALDHFQEVYWPDAAADYLEFAFFGILEGYKTQFPGEDNNYVVFGMTLLDAMMHRMEERIWAENEIKEKGKEFETRFGKGLAIETLNDDVIKLAQKMGYEIVIRKDPRKGYVRIKGLPERVSDSTQIALRESENQKIRNSDMPANRVPSEFHPKRIDLTLAYEQLKKMDPQATWFLHVSKTMLLNGTAKNPKMVPTTLSLDEITKVIEKV